MTHQDALTGGVTGEEERRRLLAGATPGCELDGPQVEDENEMEAKGQRMDGLDPRYHGYGCGAQQSQPIRDETGDVRGWASEVKGKKPSVAVRCALGVASAMDVVEDGVLGAAAKAASAVGGAVSGVAQAAADKIREVHGAFRLAIPSLHCLRCASLTYQCGAGARRSVLPLAALGRERTAEKAYDTVTGAGKDARRSGERAAGDVSDAARSAASNIADSATDAARGARGAARDAGDATGKLARDAGNAAAERAQDVKDAADKARREL
eukprot:XP_001691900.1 predicted protein [Chlamydomonas reinhardtii]